MKYQNLIYIMLIIVISFVISAVIIINKTQKEEVIQSHFPEWNVMVEDKGEIPLWLTKNYRIEEEEEDEEISVKDLFSAGSFLEEIVYTQDKNYSPVIKVKESVEVVENIERWKQPGTREYLVKMKMDRIMQDYKRYNCKVIAIKNNYKDGKITEEEQDKQLKDLEIFHCRRGKALLEAASYMGIDIYKEYGVRIIIKECCEDISEWWELDF
jgi:hypothetical protein